MILIISIHAPVKGATVMVLADDTVLGISIHAPVKGATDVFTPPQTDGKNFNPRTREGCDGP